MKDLRSKPLAVFLSALTLMAAFSLAACKGRSVTSESATPADSEPVVSETAPTSAGEAPDEDVSESVSVLIDQAGREVVIEGPVERIVSGYYISSSACIALGLKDKLVGVEAKAASRPIYKLAAPDLLELPDVGTAKEFNMEACIALEPDIVILPKRLRDSADIMEGLGIPVILVNPESHQELVAMINLIGRATDSLERAAALIGYYDDKIAEMNEKLLDANYRERVEMDASQTGKPLERAKVYMGGVGSYLSTAPRDMYQASLIDAAGGLNAAGEIEGDSWTEVSYEQISAMDPEVIIIPAEAAYGKGDILGDARLSDITAVKEGKIFEMPRDFEAWDSPAPSGTLGILWLASILREDVYSMNDMREDAAAFYREFYGVEIDTGLIGK